MASRSRRLIALPAPKQNDICLELADNSTHAVSASQFFKTRNSSDPNGQAARLCDGFIAANARTARLLETELRADFDGRDVRLVARSGNAVGAVPLVSPLTSSNDFGLVVQPRFPWPGIGPMLSEMGWRVVPAPLKLPLLHRSERRVPPWVLSSMILARIEALLSSLDRRFETVHECRSSPKGRIDWKQYAVKSISRAKFLDVPCSFPDLREDRHLLGAIRYTLDRQRQSLESQRQHGAFVAALIARCNRLLEPLVAVPDYLPTPAFIAQYVRRPLRSDSFLDGLQAIEWTVEDRGLAGVSDLDGIPWTMPMERFFEAWIETVFRRVAMDTGAVMRIGRTNETTAPLSWRPAYVGSQRSLVPDIWLEWTTTTLIIDAKYKRHWEEMQTSPWARTDEQLREAHRQDLMQVLAYANLASTSRVIACLAYPCGAETWKSLAERDRIIHCADVTSGLRAVELWLTAVPMALAGDGVADYYSAKLRRVVFNAE